MGEDLRTYSVTFDVCVAMCDTNRGISLNGILPWPHIKKDFDYYMKLTGTPEKPGMVAVNIKGRKSWEYTTLVEKNRPNVVNIIISQTLSSPPDEFVHKICPSLPEALDYVGTAKFRSQIETVWIMGGQNIYEEAVGRPECRRIYLTRILGDYPCDRFFPKFEDRFFQVNECKLDSSLNEQNGTRFQFLVYERK